MVLHVVVAPDSFKESLSAAQAAAAIAAGIRDAVPDAAVVELPMSDGGEGFCATVAASTGAELHDVTVTGPWGASHQARYAVDTVRRVAILEVAQAVGLDRVAAEDRDVMNASSYGVGELFRAALSHDIDTILVGLGGSATNDGGAGLLAALGVRLLDADGAQVPPTPIGLERLAEVDTTGLVPALARVRIRVATDVTNPLLGPQGASTVFGPQKGATDVEVERLEGSLARLAQLVDPEQTGSRRPGAGAAGGLGFALQHVLAARLEPGVEAVAEVVGLDSAVAEADLVFTAEGSIDAQTLAGKTPFGVAQVALRHGVPVLGFAGRLGPGAEALLEHGFAALVPIVPGVTDLPTALAEGEAYLRAAVATATRLITVPMRR